VAGAAILAVVACLPDVDLVIHNHRGQSHSVGVAVLAGAIAWLVTRRPRWGVAVAVAWASHVLLDWLGNDTRPPFGVMALWPLSHAYYQAGIEIFPAVSRRYWLAEFWLYNLKAAAIELGILAPIAVIVLRFTPSREKRTPT
jgi:membrane-bound metal-dependent hydrolase YbcI (DUF457 family)